MNKTKLVLAMGLMVSVAIMADTPTSLPYKVVDLGVLEGGTNSYAYSINSTGDVVGASELVSEGVFQTHAVIWKAGAEDETSRVSVDLHAGVGGTESYAYYVNDGGVAYGYANTSALLSRGFMTDGLSLLDLGLPSGRDSTSFKPQSANNSGLVTGFVNVNVHFDTTGTNPFIDLRDRPVIMDPNTQQFWVFPTVLGYSTTDGDVNKCKDTISLPATAHAINSLGDAVGYSAFDVNDLSLVKLRAMYFTKEGDADACGLTQKVVDIHPGFGGDLASSRANDINDNRLVVGFSQEAGNQSVVAFIHDLNSADAQSAINLGQLVSGRTFSEAIAINNNNTVVGTASYATGSHSRSHAFIYQYTNAATDKMEDLNSYIDCDDTSPDLAGDQPTWELLEARDINDNGLIVGFGYKVDDVDHKKVAKHAFLLKPQNALPIAKGRQCLVEAAKDSSGGSLPLIGLLSLGLMALLRRRLN